MSSNSTEPNNAGRNSSALAIWAVVLAAGLIGWIICMLYSDPARAWRALLINFLYFTPLTIGMVVWPAVVMLSNGRWAKSLEPLALASVAFAPVSILSFIVLWFGRSYWAAWMHEEPLSQGIWLSNAFIFCRDGAGLLILWALAAWFVFRKSRGKPKGTLAGVLIFAYCIVLSLLAFDLVMALDPHWYSSLFGGYFLVSGMYIAAAAWTLAVLMHRPRADKNQLHDMGKLIVAFSLLTTYMMFCQLLPIWYENLPHEVRFVIPRLRLAPWRWNSLGLLATVYLGPLVLLLLRRAKRSATYLGAIAILILVGMWVERWWLVTPTLNGKLALGLTEISLTASFVAALALAVVIFKRHVPIEVPQEEESL